jgi:serine/threonine-protein kinase
MGVVYRGYDPLIGREVALKTIRVFEIADPMERHALQERLQREAQSAGRLSHPNIVTIYQVGYAELHAGQTIAYLAMEFMPGYSLAALVESCRNGPPEAVLHLLWQAAAALDYAHSRGVIHRDIKPANLLVTPEGTLKVTDFGVAKIVSQTMTATGSVLGSPAYMSPEQIKAEAIDGRADQYSLGVVAYELFSGKRPFQGESLSTLVFQIAMQPPPPLETMRPELAARLGPVLMRALAKDPGSRFESCMQFVSALEQAVRSGKAAPLAARSVAAPAQMPRATPMPTTVTIGPAAARGRPRWLLPVVGVTAACAAIAVLGWMWMGRERPSALQPAETALPEAWESASPAVGNRPGGLQKTDQSPRTPAPEAARAPQRTPVSRPAAAGQAGRAELSAPAGGDRTPMREVSGAQPGKPQLAEASAGPAQAAPSSGSTGSLASTGTASAGPSPGASSEAAPVAATPKVEPPAAPREPVRVPPRAIQTITPGYTPEAEQKRIEGTVVLSVDIDDQGIPRRARVLRSLDPGLDRKAVESLGGWRFTPATEDGKPVAATANVEFNFRLVGSPQRTPPSLSTPRKK